MSRLPWTISFFLLLPSFVQAASLDQALLKETPAVLDFLKKKDVKNVGVLKFLVVRAGEKEATDRAGAINQTMAERLEMALILKNPIKDPIGVIENATAVAAQTPGANHLTEEGRAKLFKAEYPLAWGTDKIKAEAFLTGVVRISRSGELSVSVVAILPGEAKTIPVARFTARADVATLLEMGLGFTSRGLFEGGEVITDPAKLKEKEKQTQEKVAETASQIKQQQQKHPSEAESKPPVVVRILYGEKEQKVEIRDGEAWIAEPKEGQKVEFILERLDKTLDGSLGVVLKINGENSVEKQRVRDLECRKWILDRDEKPISVKGFLMPGGERSEAFRILSPEESKANEIRYGHDVGTISWTVFRSLKGKPPAPDPTDFDDLDARILNRGLYPTQKPRDLVALRKDWDATPTDRSRGLIGSGSVIETPTRKVTFEPDPVPILAITVRYYKPMK